MKKNDIKAMVNSMSVDEINSKIAELERELSAEYAIRSSAAGKSRNYGKIRTIKKTIARIKTFLRQKELSQNKN